MTTPGELQEQRVPAKNGNGNNGNGNGNGNGSNWPLVISGIAVVLTLVGQFWALANPRDDLKQLKADLRADIDKMLPISVHTEFVIRADRDLKRLETGLIKATDAVVPRVEHEQHWKENDARIVALREQVMELRREFSGSYNIGKQLDNLQDQIRVLQKDSQKAWPKP